MWNFFKSFFSRPHAPLNPYEEANNKILEAVAECINDHRCNNGLPRNIWGLDIKEAYSYDLYFGINSLEATTKNLVRLSTKSDKSRVNYVDLNQEIREHISRHFKEPTVPVPINREVAKELANFIRNNYVAGEDDISICI